MRRYFLYPMLFWLFVSLDEMLQGLGAALYFGHGWEKMLIWCVSLLFVGCVAWLVVCDQRMRASVLAEEAQPSAGDLIWYLVQLGLFTLFLTNETSSLHMWWTAAWVDLWFKLLFGTTLVAFWCLAGRWWRDAITTILAIRTMGLRPSGRKSR